MKEYKTSESLKKDWLLTSDLYRELAKHRFSANLNALLRWEKKGVLSPPKRVLFKGKDWRVYSKEDISSIINSLIELSSKPSVLRKKERTLQKQFTKLKIL